MRHLFREYTCLSVIIVFLLIANGLAFFYAYSPLFRMWVCMEGGKILCHQVCSWPTQESESICPNIAEGKFGNHMMECRYIDEDKMVCKENLMGSLF